MSNRKFDGPTDPAENVVACVPADSDLSVRTRGVWVGGAGNLRVTDHNGNDTVISSVPAGTLLPIRVKRVWATNTTATLITLFY